jgi:hypothetical protein
MAVSIKIPGRCHILSAAAAVTNYKNLLQEDDRMFFITHMMIATVVTQAMIMLT